ncbi:MAG TPA: (Fe-S)-binding protein [Thermodesulfobacteriota bacterium]|nr:(Fe-S)-binding protein [Thermodesulfobacteriota bacterium]
MMEFADILHRCFRCGYCKFPNNYQDFNCPSYSKFRFETYSPGGRMWLLRAWLNGEMKSSARLAEILFSCATCGNCVEHCVFPKFKDDILHAFLAAREEMVNQGTVPPAVRDYLKTLQVHGNPYKLPRLEREKWKHGLNLESYSGQEYLFHAGCVGSLDERGIKMARSVAGLLKKLGVSLGTLGIEENCDGNEALALGEKGVFQSLVEKNLQSFQRLGVKKVITLTPHAYHAFKNDYPKDAYPLEVFHYTQILSAQAKKLSALPTPSSFRVTYHDPCYLGRHNKEYQAPRKILKSISGLQLLEMGRAKENAFCCGGGGGNFFTELLGSGAESPARARVREAADTNASVLAVACPNCAKMLDDAVKSENLEEKIVVKEISEIIQGAA